MKGKVQIFLALGNQRFDITDDNLEYNLEIAFLIQVWKVYFYLIGREGCMAYLKFELMGRKPIVLKGNPQGSLKGRTWTHTHLTLAY
jgi:hypothetical protein